MLKRIKQRMRPITLSRGVDIVCRLYHRGSSTPRWYRSVFRLVIDSWGDIPIHQVTAKMVDGWYDALQDSPRSSWTVHSYMRCVRSFFNKMVEMGHLEASPAGHVVLPKLPKRGPKSMPLEDVQKMVQYSRWHPRDHAIIRTLASTGCRVGELVSMRMGPAHLFLDPPVGRAVVLGKGNKFREIRFGEKTIESICGYLEVRHAWVTDDHLWLSHQGRPFTAQGVYHMLRKVAKRADVKRFNPHAFRHAFAQRLHDSGAPPRFIQELLGHEDVTTTLAMYVNYDGEALNDMYQKFDVDKLDFQAAKPHS